MGTLEVYALRGIDLEIQPGEIIAIMGPSGSGKSTLMNMIGCLDSPSSGEYYLDGQLVSDLVDDELAAVRNKKIGFVFQNYNLLPRANALQNVELPLRYSDEKTSLCERSAGARKVGLANRITTNPWSFRAGSSSAWPLPAQS